MRKVIEFLFRERKRKIRERVETYKEYHRKKDVINQVSI